MKKLIYWVVLVMTCLQLVACATSKNVSLSNEARVRIKSVSIRETVAVPDSVFFFGMKQAMPMALGALGGGAADATSLDDKIVLKTLIQQNNIKVGEVLRSTFETQLQQSNIFPKIVRGVGDAEFVISISSYGLFKKGAFDGDLRASIWGKASLVSVEGQVLWEKAIKPMAFENRVPAYSFEYYKEHPNALREGFKILSSIVVTELLEDLK
jgi:hypothetical protein